MRASKPTQAVAARRASRLTATGNALLQCAQADKAVLASLRDMPAVTTAAVKIVNVMNFFRAVEFLLADLACGEAGTVSCIP